MALTSYVMRQILQCVAIDLSKTLLANSENPNL